MKLIQKSALTRPKCHGVPPSVQPDRPRRAVRPVRHAIDDGPELIRGVPLEFALLGVAREQFRQRLVYTPPAHLSRGDDPTHCQHALRTIRATHIHPALTTGSYNPPRSSGMTHFTRTWSNPSAASTQSASPAGIARVDQSMSSYPSRTRPKNASPGDPRLSGPGTKSTPVMRCSTCTRRSLAATSSWNARGHTGRPPSTLRCTPAIPLPGSPLPHPLSLVLTLPLEVADISSSDIVS